MKRYNPDIEIGLSKKQIEERIKDNLINYDTNIPTKTRKRIIYENIFTIFNLLNFILAMAVFSVHSYKNLLFIGIVICNTIISTVQELHSKYVVDKLSLIAASKSIVIRSGHEETISVSEIVLDDIIKYKIGNQVVTDSIIKDGSVEVDESNITGESNHIYKKEGDLLLSGSFIVSGKCIAQVEHVADDNYSAKISKEAKYLKKVNSQIMFTLNKIIKTISCIIIPLGLLLFLHQYKIDDGNIANAVVNTVAAIIGMIPEGLILLTSTVLAVSALRLAHHKVLVQQLYCIETLARVDTICLDKTGTITEGCMEVEKVITIDDHYNIEEILCNLTTSLNDENETMKAIANAFPCDGYYKESKIIPFSSSRKYSGVTYENLGTFIIGAPDILTKDQEILKKVNNYSNYRTLLLGHTNFSVNDHIPNLHIIAIIVLKDKIRKNAIQTLNYLKEQDVDVKIISGDSLKSVVNIADSIGLTDVKAIDLYDKKDGEIKELVSNYNIFCRVTPIQKKLIVTALKELGHCVAMTGDGVNDVLALKEADCSIAIASGSEAARNVSEIVLLDSSFESIPKIVMEGRRTINNIERSASLFLTKTTYATILAILFLFLPIRYPFIPIQLSLTSAITIGIPSFILALEPNHERIHGNFFLNIIRKSIPAALTIVIDVIGVIILANAFSISPSQTSTMAILLVAFTGFLLIFKICYPFDRIRFTMYICLILLFVICILGFSTVFEIVMLDHFMFAFILILCVLDVGLFHLMSKICDVNIIKNKEKILR